MIEVICLLNDQQKREFKSVMLDNANTSEGDWKLYWLGIVAAVEGNPKQSGDILSGLLQAKDEALAGCARTELAHLHEHTAIPSDTNANAFDLFLMATEAYQRGDVALASTGLVEALKALSEYEIGALQYIVGDLFVLIREQGLEEQVGRELTRLKGLGADLPTIEYWLGKLDAKS